MQTIAELWRRWTATRYTRMLEADVERLRAENRALLNSILGIAGVPPISVPATEMRRGEAIGDHRASSENGPSLRRSISRAQGAVPVRRRSWHQINRALEIDSARKKEQVADGGSE